jgi:hypothetical protein
MVGESISKIVVEVSEGIGDCIAEVYDVSLVYKLVLKGETIVRFATCLLSQFSACPIAHLRTLAHPPNTSLLESHHRED